jgi:lysylphosphatidylglycerol synthetase-like protein (DUF2156 family)
MNSCAHHRCATQCAHHAGQRHRESAVGDGFALSAGRRTSRGIFPLTFRDRSRYATLLIGFALILLSFSIRRRRRRAYYGVLLLSLTSILFNIAKGLDYGNALISLVLVLAYGIVGFWVLDVRAFGMNFSLGDAIWQTLPDFLPVYRRLGFRRLKLGDDAIVDLPTFSLAGGENKTFRKTVNRMENQGVQILYQEPPIPDEILAQARAVSDEWLPMPGRRELGFTQGMFEPDYVRSTPIEQMNSIFNFGGLREYQAKFATR